MASPNALKGGIVRIQRGLAIYLVNASPYWYARIRDPSTKRHVVRSTKETSQLLARKVAEELFLSVIRNSPLAVPENRTFGHFADELISDGKAQG